MNREVDVLIAGGGMVGLALACALKSSQLDVALVESQAMPTPVTGDKPAIDGVHLQSGFEPRVSAINPAAKDFLTRVGGWPDAERICPMARMQVWDGRGTAHIDFEAASIDEPALGYIVENRNLLATLSATASEQENLTLMFDTEIVSIGRVGDRHEVTLGNGDVVSARLLVGADGGNSVVRKQTGIRSIKWSYGQDAMVCAIGVENPHELTARQWFTPIGTLAFLPLPVPDQKLCSIVWSTSHTEELLGLDEQTLCERLTQTSEQALGRVVAVGKRYSFPLNQQHALRYVRPGLALIGDAAHIIHPLAGQGVNLGFADANALSIELSECRFSGSSPGDIGLLRRYQRKRQPFNLLMTTVMEAFRRGYEPNHPAINWARNAGMRFVNDSRMLKSMVMKVASGR